MTYDDYVTGLANLLVVPSTDSNFTTALTNIIADAENRIYRELDLLAARVTVSNTTLSSGVRTTTISTNAGTMLVVEGVNVITPSSVGAALGTRVPLTPVSREVLDITYPSAATANTGTPQFWAMYDNTTILLGPCPDAGYAVEFVGTIRPAALSSANSSTILTQMLPDLFMAASCVFGAAYLKNFGAAADDPKSGITWEAVYQSRLLSAGVEELRKKHHSQGWTSKQPSAIATPQRV